MFKAKGSNRVSKEERRTKFLRRVFELAATGRYDDYLGIEVALSGEFPEARGRLDQKGVREDIRVACATAKKSLPDPMADR